MDNEKNELTISNTQGKKTVIGSLREAYSLATTLCKAGIIPDAYKDKPADCMVAIDMVNRMGVSIEGEIEDITAKSEKGVQKIL